MFSVERTAESTSRSLWDNVTGMQPYRHIELETQTDRQTDREREREVRSIYNLSLIHI